MRPPPPRLKPATMLIETYGGRTPADNSPTVYVKFLDNEKLTAAQKAELAYIYGTMFTKEDRKTFTRDDYLTDRGRTFLDIFYDPTHGCTGKGPPPPAWFGRKELTMSFTKPYPVPDGYAVVSLLHYTWFPSS